MSGTRVGMKGSCVISTDRSFELKSTRYIEPNIRILILKISGICKDWVDGTYHTHGNDLGGFSCPQAPKEKQ